MIQVSQIYERLRQIEETIAKLQAEKHQLESQLHSENLIHTDSPLSSQPATSNTTNIPVQTILTTEQKLQLFSRL